MSTLFIDVQARFAQFQDSLDRVSRDVQSQVRGMETAFARVGNAVGGLAAIVGAGAFGSAIKGLVGTLADFDDAAEKTGASVESLSSLFNTLAPTGVSLETITDVAGKLTKAMAGADEESSKAASAFKALGIATTDSLGNLRSVDDVLVDVAQALSTYADGTNKTAIAQALLGKTGAEYLPILKDLAGRQRDAATVTTEQAAAAESLANAWRSLGVESQKLAQTLGGPLIVALSVIVERFNAAGNAGENFYNRLRLAFQPEREIGRLEKNVADLQDEFDKLSKQKLDPVYDAGKIDRLAALTRDLARARKELEAAQPVKRLITGEGMDGAPPGAGSKGQAPRLPDDAKPRKEQISDGERLLKQLEERLTATQQLNEVEKLTTDIILERVKFDSDAQREQALSLAARIDGAKELADLAKKETDALILRAKTQDEANQRETEAAENAERAIASLVEGYKNLADPTRQYRLEIERINKLEEENRLTSEEALGAREAQYKRIAELLDETAEKTESVKDIAEELGLTFSSAFEDAIVNAEKFSKVLQGLAKDIARLVVRETVTKPLAGTIAGIIGQGFGSGGGVENIGTPINPDVTLPNSLRGGGMGEVPKSAGMNVTVNVEAGATKQDVLNGINAGMAEVESRIYKSMRNGGQFAAA